MADFEKAFDKIIDFQGNNHHTDGDDESDEIRICSACFFDEGLKIDAYTVGIENNDECPNCKSKTGHKLTQNLVRKLCSRFFVRGTIEKSSYGGSPLIQFNDYHFKQSNIDVSRWLKDDIALIENVGKIGFFYYGPRLWMIGEIEPLKALQSEIERDQVIDRILKAYPVRELTKEKYFYRLRLNPKTPHDFSEYDSAPDEFLGRNRLDNINFPVLYGSPDLELCLHECRSTVEDNIYVARLVPNQTLKLLDLSTLIEEDNTEFESLDIAIHFLFLAGKHSYDICRRIAFAAKENGFDGLIYPSYFSYIRTGHIPFDTVYGISIRKISQFNEYAQSQGVPNIALFGRPLKEKKLNADCINKIIINRIGYELSFGPAFHNAYSQIKNFR